MPTTKTKKPDIYLSGFFVCGKRGIRTPGTPKGTTDFESAPIDHSGSFPCFEAVNINNLKKLTNDDR